MRKTKLKTLTCFFVLFGCLMSTYQAVADEIKVAVASNFYPTMKVIAQLYELKTAGSTGHHKVILIPGSSGKHYAQIMNGAPFDIFFSADTKHAKLLEQEGRVDSGTRFTYAKGKLILWSSIDNYVDSKGEVLEKKIINIWPSLIPNLLPMGNLLKKL